MSRVSGRRARATASGLTVPSGPGGTSVTAAAMRLREEVLLRAVAKAEGFRPDPAFESRAVRQLAQRFETDEKSIRKSLSEPLMQRELLRMRVLEVVLAPENA